MGFVSLGYLLLVIQEIKAKHCLKKIEN